MSIFLFSHPTVEADSEFPVCCHQLPVRELSEGRYRVRFARTEGELDAIQKLRFEVFNLELGEGLQESYETGRDSDTFDPVCHHLIVLESSTDKIVGCYRMQTAEMADRFHGFYSAGLFDLAMIPPAVRSRSIEVGRACVAHSHRSTQVLFLLWKGLAMYVAANSKRFFFGCSSLTSQDPHQGKALFDLLSARDQLHPDIQVLPRPELLCFEDGFEARSQTRVKIPRLFRTYLRHGAKICGPPAIDREFGTIDYLALFDVEAMTDRWHRVFFG